MPIMIEIHHYLHFDTGQLSGIEASLATLLKKGTAIMNDLTVLKQKMDALEAKATETNATLAGLAQAVIDLKNSGDVQAGIDALAAQAQNVLDGLTAAEDAADDQLPGV